MDDARKAAENLGSEVDRWAMWLQDKDADLSHMKPTGGLPETAQSQLDDFFVLKVFPFPQSSLLFYFLAYSFLFADYVIPQNFQNFRLKLSKIALH